MVLVAVVRLAPSEAGGKSLWMAHAVANDGLHRVYLYLEICATSLTLEPCKLDDLMQPI